MPVEPPPLRRLELADWLRESGDADLEVVAERPAYWENAAPWDTGWRAMPWNLVILVVRGAMRLQPEGAPAEDLRPGMLFWTTPQMRHRVLVEAGRYYFLRFRLLAQDGANLSFGGIRIQRETQPLEPLFELLCDDLRLGHPHLGARLRALIVLLASADAPAAETEGRGFTPALRRRLAQLVRERQDTGLRPADLARGIGMSPITFARSFRRAFGCSPRRWLAEQRLRAAAQRLVGSTAPVAAIAAQSGFANPSQFARGFRRLFGSNPAAYRREHGITAELPAAP